MRYENVDHLKADAGGYCRKGCENCFCQVGWPWEKRCANCRGEWYDGDLEFWDSFCECPPPPEPRVLLSPDWEIP